MKLEHVTIVVLAIVLITVSECLILKSKPVWYNYGGKVWDRCEESSVTCNGSTTEMLHCFRDVKGVK